MSSTRKMPEHAAYSSPPREDADTEAAADEAAPHEVAEAVEAARMGAAEEVAEVAADAVGVAVFGLDLSESVSRLDTHTPASRTDL
jgi:hypothetical protein